jgi:hypothetical protein
MKTHTRGELGINEIGHVEKRDRIEARYSTNKSKLRLDMIEVMRAQYKGCEPFLSTARKPEERAVVKEAEIKALKSIAKNLLGIDLLDVKVTRDQVAFVI